MHFEVLVEDQSGTVLVDIVLEKILGTNGSSNSWRLHPYKGIGRIPKNLVSVTDPAKRILLDQLLRILQGYGRSLQDVEAAVIVVVDLDDRDCLLFKRELVRLLNACNPRPTTLLRIAIEEIEAWLLGDQEAIMLAYPTAKIPVLSSYAQDSISGTWEVLANAIYPGGSARLKKLGYPEIGRAKCRWAETIGPYMDITRNQSRSFQVFREGVRRVAGCDG